MMVNFGCCSYIEQLTGGKKRSLNYTQIKTLGLPLMLSVRFAFGSEKDSHILMKATILTVLSLIQAGSLYADVRPSDLVMLSLEELMQVPVSVATKTSQKIAVAPSTVSLFTREDLERMGVKNLVDLFRQIPGFYSMYNPVEGNQSYLVTRGLAQKYATTLLVLYNGQRLNDDYTGGSTYFTRFLNLSQIDRIEIIRGTGSALYGSNAFSGVVNIITRPDSSIAAGIGSHNAKELSVAAGQTGNDWAIWGALSAYEDDGDTFNNIFDRFGLQTTTSDPRQTSQLELFLQLGPFAWRTLYIESQRDNYYLFRRVRDGVTQIELNTLLSRFDYSDRWTEALEMKAALELNQSERASLTALAPQDPQDFPEADFLFGEQINYESLRLSFDGNGQLSVSQMLGFGGEVVHSRVPDGLLRSNYNIFGDLEYLGQVVTFRGADLRVVLDKKREIRSAYVQLESDWGERLQTTFGMRYDAYNDVDGRANPRAAVVLEHEKGKVFKLIYGEAYRAPSLGDLYDEESGLTSGNTDLKPSTIRSHELSYGQTTEAMFLSTVLFANWIDDLIGFKEQNGTVFLDNVANNESRGLELEWMYKLSKEWTLAGNLTHLFVNKTDLGLAIGLSPSEALAPNTYGNVSLTWRSDEHWQSSVMLNGRSEVDVLRDNEALFLVDWTLFYRFTSTHELKLLAHNVMDKNYFTGSAVALGMLNGQTIQQYPARGRFIELSYRYRFN